MSADSAVTYTSVHSKARSWSIPSEDPYEEAARQLLEQAPRSPEYVPDPMELEDHVPVYIPKPEHPEDLVPAEDEAPIEAYITEVASAPPLPPSFLPSLIRPPRTRATMAQMRAAAPSTYHLLLPSGTPPLLPIPLPAPSTSRKADIPEVDTPPQKRLLLTAPRPGCEVGESSAAAAARQPGPTMARRVDCSSIDTVETRIRDTERRIITLRVLGCHSRFGAMMQSGMAMTATLGNRLAEGTEPFFSVVREYTYHDFMKCKPLYFKGTGGVVELTQWNEMKKLKVELWNLKVKGTDVIGYNQRFQELALLCLEQKKFEKHFRKQSKHNNRNKRADHWQGLYCLGTGQETIASSVCSRTLQEECPMLKEQQKKWKSSGFKGLGRCVDAKRKEGTKMETTTMVELLSDSIAIFVIAGKANVVAEIEQERTRSPLRVRV
ncbi:hypothetical protein Tco_0246093 [Tanacetum coccineum]